MIWFHDKLTCLRVIILIRHCCLTLGDSFLTASNRRGYGGICRDVSDEGLLLSELWPLPQNRRSVVWYYRWLVCLAGVFMASIEACSKQKGEGSSSKGSLTFVRELLWASFGVFWAVMWAMELCFLIDILRRTCFQSSKLRPDIAAGGSVGSSVFLFKKINIEL